MTLLCGRLHQSELEEACSGSADEVDGVCDVVKEGEGVSRVRFGRRKEEKERLMKRKMDRRAWRL